MMRCGLKDCTNEAGEGVIVFGVGWSPDDHDEPGFEVRICDPHMALVSGGSVTDFSIGARTGHGGPSEYGVSMVDPPKAGGD